MPLKKVKKGATIKEKRKVASDNIKREIHAGKSKKQAIAIGLSSAGLSNKNKGKRK